MRIRCLSAAHCRQQFLRARYFFLCTCPLCSLPHDELAGWVLNSGSCYLVRASGGQVLEFCGVHVLKISIFRFGRQMPRKAHGCVVVRILPNLSDRKEVEERGCLMLRLSCSAPALVVRSFFGIFANAVWGLGGLGLALQRTRTIAPRPVPAADAA